MDSENKWEYDYSSTNNSSGGDTGYPNVGSSGMNTANTASQFGDNAAGSGAAQDSASGSYNGSDTQYVRPTPQNGGGATPPPAQPASPDSSPKKKRRFNAGKAARSVAALVLAAAVGFGGGVVGAKMTSGTKVVLQTVERSGSSTASALSTSTGGNELSYSQVSAAVSPSVVAITTEEVVYSQWSWYGQSQVQSGAGSGVIISEDGYILTCDHVVTGASNITVTIGDTDYTATIVGEDSTSDIAVIKIDATGLTAAAIGDSDALAVGEEVVAVGNPLGKLSGTVTNGIISALNRDVSVEGNNMTLIQTNASISPGNSGGGLFNMAGELVGIVNAKSSDTDAEGLGFAIPINEAITVAQDLLENGYVTGRPYMGISYYAVTDSSTAQQLGLSSYGIYIVQVVSGGPADKAGLQAGDRIVSIDGTEISEQSDMSSALGEYSAGDTISVTVARDGKMVTVDLTLGEKTAENSTTQQSTQQSQNSGN